MNTFLLARGAAFEMPQKHHIASAHPQRLAMPIQRYNAHLDV